MVSSHTTAFSDQATPISATLPLPSSHPQALQHIAAAVPTQCTCRLCWSWETSSRVLAYGVPPTCEAGSPAHVEYLENCLLQKDKWVEDLLLKVEEMKYLSKTENRRNDPHDNLTEESSQPKSELSVEEIEPEDPFNKFVSGNRHQIPSKEVPDQSAGETINESEETAAFMTISSTALATDAAYPHTPADSDASSSTTCLLSCECDFDKPAYIPIASDGGPGRQVLLRARPFSRARSSEGGRKRRRESNQPYSSIEKNQQRIPAIQATEVVPDPAISKRKMDERASKRIRLGSLKLFPRISLRL
ncbi:hypothetical protein K488DRAFT_87436 [Vararia minispora EC-137]|uniref:Uncharacterized protein n=1 Tax=Vararia minispora EC-137 TaxID=1314806 RepID=A0ACB8QG45_9AGAM|nr:hypothetical protein K488DRAFT_87436 [Vararia minispora EC-137]